MVLIKYRTERNSFKNIEETGSGRKNEIASRYYFQNGRIEVSIKNDPYIKSALGVFSDMSQYNGILDGSIKE